MVFSNATLHFIHPGNKESLPCHRLSQSDLLLLQGKNLIFRLILYRFSLIKCVDVKVLRVNTTFSISFLKLFLYIYKAFFELVYM